MTRWRLTLVSWCAVVFLRCASSGLAGPTPEIPSLPIISGQLYAGILVPRAVNFPDSWTPTQAQVSDAEPKLQQCILAERRRLRSTLPRFFRQYSGITLSDRRYLRIDFLDTRYFRADEVRHPLAVCDAEDDVYFVVIYDFESETCFLWS
jgi:hypothetical protein